MAGAESHFFDLESSLDRQALSVAAERTLAPLRGLVVLDEVQTMPQLLPVLRVLADRRETPARFLLLGSASPDLIRGAAESLAGRVAFVQLGGFDVTETGVGERGTALGTRRLSALVPGGGRRRELRVASGFHRDFPQP